MTQLPRTNREADPHSPSNAGLSTALCETPCPADADKFNATDRNLGTSFMCWFLRGEATRRRQWLVSIHCPESPGPTWACLPSPHKLLDPFPKVMLHSTAFSEYGPRPAQGLVIWEVFKEEVGSQILGPRRTSEEVPAVVRVAPPPHQCRWEKWSDAGFMWSHKIS